MIDMNKIVLITGASSGMGRETAKLLAESGYTIYGAARRLERMDDLKALGINPMQMDVADDDSMVRCVNEILAREGRIDVLINNAGFGLYGAVEEVAMKDARYQFEVNVFGLARLSQLVMPHMRAQGSGKIVNISSIGGKMATPLGGWYYASKYAVEGLSDSMRLEVRDFGIDIILIEPGGIRTEWPGIAYENLRKISGDTAYKELVEKNKKFFDMMNKGSEPIVIARLIKRAIEARRPKARYWGGYFAGLTLFARRWLGDRAFDRLIMRLTGMD